MERFRGVSSNAPFNTKRAVPNFTKRKEGEVNVVASQPRAQQPLMIPREQQQQNKFDRPLRKFGPLLMPPSQLLQHLVKASLVELKPLAASSGALPPRYDANARCEYHANSLSHTLQKCWAFKNKVQDLLEAQDITFKKPNIKSKPMPLWWSDNKCN